MRLICRSFSVSAYLTTRLEDAPCKGNNWIHIVSSLSGIAYLLAALPFLISRFTFPRFPDSRAWHHSMANPITGHYFVPCHSTALATLPYFYLCDDAVPHHTLSQLSHTVAPPERRCLCTLALGFCYAKRTAHYYHITFYMPL